MCNDLFRGWALINFSYLQGGRLFEAGRLLTFPTYRVGAYSRWALIRGWALINFSYLHGGRLFEVGAYSRLDAY